MFSRSDSPNVWPQKGQIAHWGLKSPIFDFLRFIVFGDTIDRCCLFRQVGPLTIKQVKAQENVC